MQRRCVYLNVCKKCTHYLRKHMPNICVRLNIFKIYANYMRPTHVKDMKYANPMQHVCVQICKEQLRNLKLCKTYATPLRQ